MMGWCMIGSWGARISEIGMIEEVCVRWDMWRGKCVAVAQFRLLNYCIDVESCCGIVLGDYLKLYMKMLFMYPINE